MSTQKSEPLLALDRLAVSYGGIQAVKGIDVTVGSGELVCLIGANGAGKTTTLKGICGLLPIKSGTIRYAGEDITGRPPFTLVRRGLALVPEGRGVFGALTIEENLAMGAYARRDRDAIRNDTERAFTVFPRLKKRRRQTAGTLSGGEPPMPAIARPLLSPPTLPPPGAAPPVLGRPLARAPPVTPATGVGLSGISSPMLVRRPAHPASAHPAG